MAESVERVTFELTARGAEQTRQAFNATSTAIKQTDDNFTQLSSSVSKTASTVGALGAALGKVSPDLGAFGQSVGRASGAIQNMSAVLGGGLAGIAVGGVIAVLGIFAERMSAARKEAEELARAQDELAKSTAKAAEEQLTSERALAKAATKRAFDYGKSAEVLSLEAALAQAREDRKSVFKSIEVAGGFLEVGKAQADKLDENIADLERLLVLARAKVPTKKKERAGRKPKPYDSAEFEESVARNPIEMRDVEGVIDTTLGEFDQRSTARELAQQKEDDAKKKSERERVRMAKESDRELAKLDKERLARVKEFESAGVDAMRMVGESSILALAAIARGEKVSAKVILAGIGDQLVSKGTFYLFEGIAREIASYGTDASGAGLIGLGLAEIGAGLALGAAASSGAPGGRGAGGGGGGGSPKYYVQGKDGFYTETAIEPTARPSSSMGGTQITTINMPTVVSPSAQDGQRIRKAEAEARRQGV